MQTISRMEAKQLIEGEQDVAVIEVLDEEYFAKFHLPGARNVPLDEEFDQHIQEVVPDKSQAVLVYCHDSECDASPKAASRMEELGYQQVYDYEAGKTDWKEAGLPVET